MIFIKYQIVYRLNAIQNVREAKARYKKQWNGLQREFAESIKEAIQRMEAYPEAFAVRYRNIRLVHTNRFPYSIHFYIDPAPKQIVITNIIHDSRYYPSE